MPRQGKQLNIWIPDEVMTVLEQWAQDNQTTKTDGVVQAIQILTGTHPEAPPELRVQVRDLVATIGQLQQKLDHLETQMIEDLYQRVEWLESEISGLHPEAYLALKDLDTTLEEASREQLRETCTQLGIKNTSKWSQDKLKQAIQIWRPD